VFNPEHHRCLKTKNKWETLPVYDLLSDLPITLHSVAFPFDIDDPAVMQDKVDPNALGVPMLFDWNGISDVGSVKNLSHFGLQPSICIPF